MPQHYERTERRRRQIAQAALEVLVEEGLGRLTTRSIAARVGLSDGALFRHFDSKRDIILAAMGRLDELMFAVFPAPTLDPLERLEQFFRSRARLLGHPSSPGRLVFSSQLLHAAGEPGLEMVQRWMQRNLEFVCRCLDELQQSERLADRHQPAHLVPVVQGMLLTYSTSLAVFDDDDTLERRIDRDWTTLERLITR